MEKCRFCIKEGLMENKHDRYTLAQYQSLPLDAKIRMTQE